MTYQLPRDRPARDQSLEERRTMTLRDGALAIRREK